ncbi:1-(5-phosphoribosyl)-5-[(5-phosphoribosylamino)methylideneamino]imidazole-4-carboxamide isomerase [Alistipes sp. Z76]|nr:1-(5-phosphoribosyl)-5-[(5-phosphoribosylamino)methylideneamino]imidazole-4-carboxamide isomerase [Alistipes sp. Z76]NCE67016.1 1-(5-phosphoribosyl)-5-[(5-phosphoribosylamino)methylideneamino]imidazole-4-carboxamide isomerase [Muribaculaceae bacterium M3]
MRTQIIPAIDIIDGRCVRLSQGDYDRRRVYDASPEDMAKRYADCGVRRIHVVDLDGAKSSSPKNLKTLERMAVGASVEIEWGGGIKSEDALRALFDYGADCAIVGSVAAREPELFIEWLLRFGGERMILGVDVRDGRVSVNGWREDLNLGVDDMVGEFLPHGVKQVVCTDISKDGMLQGPSFDLYTDLQRRYDGVDFTVSGGIGSMSDIVRLDELGLRKAIVGKAVYENRITLKDIERWSLNE